VNSEQQRADYLYASSSPTLSASHNAVARSIACQVSLVSVTPLPDTLEITLPFTLKITLPYTFKITHAVAFPEIPLTDAQWTTQLHPRQQIKVAVKRPELYPQSNTKRCLASAQKCKGEHRPASRACSGRGQMRGHQLILSRS